MSTNCDHCGYRDNEVKSGAAISEKGKRITLRVEDREDLSRDILKVRFRFYRLAETYNGRPSERNLWSHDFRDRPRPSCRNSWRQVYHAGRNPRTSL